MSKKSLCACGEEHDTNQPLIITITTCPNKNHRPHITTGSQCKKTIVHKSYHECSSTEETQSNHSQANNKRSTEDERTSSMKHLLICEDESDTVPSHFAVKPLIDNAIYCDLDNEPEKLDPEPTSILTEVPAVENKEIYVSNDDTADDTFFDPCLLPSEDEQVDVEEEPPEKEVDQYPKSSPDKPLKCGLKSCDREVCSQDVTNNFPSDVEMKLPILIPRYHGRGCAMEVNVLEKHEAECRYKKLKNPDRNPADDRAGSYEIIGRLLFKTCHPTPKLNNQNINCIRSNDSTTHKTKVATIYSLFNIPYKIKKRKKIHLAPTESEEQLKRYLRRKKILEDLVKSSKSFPNHSKCKTMSKERILEPVRNSREVNRSGCNDVEVLYFYGQKRNQSVQMSGQRELRSKNKYKKWYHYIFPCISVQKSYTALPVNCSNSIFR